MADLARYTTGLHRVSEHVYAFMQPDGSWGLNNLGIVVGKGRSLLIDAATDIPRTRAVVDALAREQPKAAQIDSVLFTHWHLDHVWGAALFPEGQRIVASKIVAKYLRDHPTESLLRSILSLEGDGKKMMDYFLGDKFDFRGLRAVYATEEFEGHIDLDLDGVHVAVTETKPSHTLSDSIVHLPSEGVVHIGDLFSADRHWLLQYPSSANLLTTLETLLALDAQVYIPGHGPLLDRTDVRAFRDYVQYIRDQVRTCYDAGRNVEQTFEHLLHHLGPYDALEAPHRLDLTIQMLYAEFDKRTDVYRSEGLGRYGASWRLMQSIPERFPHLAHVKPYVIDAVRSLATEAAAKSP